MQPREGKAGKAGHNQIGINYRGSSLRRLKVYLSVPMIANRALNRAELMARAITDSGNEVSSPWDMGPVERGGRGSVDVFRRDTEGAEGCDLLVADVSNPRSGVGMEIMAAHKAGRKVVLVARTGQATSWMLRHMDNKETVD